MDCSPKAKLFREREKKVTYAGNCLTWLIVKPVLHSMNTWGSGLRRCMQLSMALMVCSNNPKELKERFKKLAVLLFNDFLGGGLYILAHIIMSIPHHGCAWKPSNVSSSKARPPSTLRPDLICLPQSALIHVWPWACLSSTPLVRLSWVRETTVVLDECIRILYLWQSGWNKWKLDSGYCCKISSV